MNKLFFHHYSLFFQNDLLNSLKLVAINDYFPYNYMFIKNLVNI
jgi:hypothetical protein